MTEQKPSTTEQILDLLLDALAQRQKARGGETTPSPLPSLTREREAIPSPQTEGASETRPSSKGREEWKRPTTLAEAASREPAPIPELAPRPGEKGWQPPARLPSIQMGRLLGRLAIALAVLVVLVNIPIKSHGVSLARLLPDSASLVIRDGLILKGSGPEIYELRNERLHWITSMERFEEKGLTWDDVHVVDDEFLAQFEMGYPIGTIYKCEGSTTIYALVDGKKRWIKDIETFMTEGYTWEDVHFVTCGYLRNLPDGLPIPEDAGTPPEP